MALQSVVYLTFIDSARAAMEFYRSVFGGELVLTTYAEMGAEGDAPERGDLVANAQLTTPEGLLFMASDVPPEVVGGQTLGIGHVEIMIGGQAPEDLDRVRSVFEALSEGAYISMPFGPVPWNATYGALVDRFGVPWQFNVDDPADIESGEAGEEFAPATADGEAREA